MLHRTRDLLMRQRTQVINALRAHMAELGMTAAQGNAGLRELLAIIAGSADERLPVEAHGRLIVLAAELQTMRTLIASIEKRTSSNPHPCARIASRFWKTGQAAAPARSNRSQVYGDGCRTTRPPAIRACDGLYNLTRIKCPRLQIS
jgi:transposase